MTGTAAVDAAGTAAAGPDGVTSAQEDRIAQARAVLARAELRTGARSLPVDRAARLRTDSTAISRTDNAAPSRPGGESTAQPRTDSAAVVRPTAGPVLAGPVLVGAAPAPSIASPSSRRAVPQVVASPSRAASPAGALVAVDDPDLPAPSARPVAAVAAGGPSRGSVLLTDRPPLTVPPALVPLLPDGLRRGSTTAVLGSTSLVLAMIAAACTAREAWAAVVGQPSLGLLAAAQSGVALRRLAVVPRPGVEAPTVVAALLDGIDVVVVGPGAVLTDADRRRLMARARDRGSVLISTAPWAGAGCVLTVEGRRWSGVGEGDGRLRAHELRLTRTGRGSAGRAQDLSIVLPLDGTTDPYGLPVTPTVPTAAPVLAPTGTEHAPALRLVG